MDDLRFYIFGVPDGFDLSQGDIDTIRYFQLFYDGSDDDAKLTIHRRVDGKVSYNYLRYNILSKEGRAGAFFGMSLLFSGVYCYDAIKLYDLFDSVYKKIILKNGIILRELPAAGGQVKFGVRRFSECLSEVAIVEQIIRKNLQNLFAEELRPLDATFTRGEADILCKINPEDGNGQILNVLRAYSWVSVSDIYRSGTTIPDPEVIGKLTDGYADVADVLQKFMDLTLEKARVQLPGVDAAVAKIEELLRSNPESVHLKGLHADYTTAKDQLQRFIEKEESTAAVSEAVPMAPAGDAMPAAEAEGASRDDMPAADEEPLPDPLPGPGSDPMVDPTPVPTAGGVSQMPQTPSDLAGPLDTGRVDNTSEAAVAEGTSAHGKRSSKFGPSKAGGTEAPQTSRLLRAGGSGKKGLKRVAAVFALLAGCVVAALCIFFFGPSKHVDRSAEDAEPVRSAHAQPTAQERVARIQEAIAGLTPEKTEELKALFAAVEELYAEGDIDGYDACADTLKHCSLLENAKKTDGKTSEELERDMDILLEFKESGYDDKEHSIEKAIEAIKTISEKKSPREGKIGEESVSTEKPRITRRQAAKKTVPGPVTIRVRKGTKDVQGSPVELTVEEYEISARQGDIALSGGKWRYEAGAIEISDSTANPVCLKAKKIGAFALSYVKEDTVRATLKINVSLPADTCRRSGVAAGGEKRGEASEVQAALPGADSVESEPATRAEKTEN